MTDEFQRGLLTGLAMQPLQVTTEHAEPDEPTSEPAEFVRGFVNSVNKINIIHAIGADAE